MKKWLKVLLIVIGSLIVLISAIALFISPIAKSYIEKHDRELIGRKIRMENLNINIFNGSVHFERLKLYEKDDTNKFVTIDSFYVNMNIMPLLKQKVDVERIFLGGANIVITQKDTIFNFSDIIKKFSSPDTAKKDTTSSPWEISLNNIDIRNTRIIYKDLELGSHFDLKNLALHVPSIYFSNKASDIGLNLNFAQGGYLGIKAKYNMKTTNYLLGINLKGFDINAVLPYLQQSLNVASLQGILSTQLNIKGETNHVMNFVLNGNIALNNLSLKDNKQKNIVSANTIRSTIAKIDLRKNTFIIDNVTLIGVKSHFDMNKNGTNNFSYLVKPSKHSSATTSTKESKMDFIIKDINVQNTDFTFNDNTLRQPFSYNLSKISVQSKDFTLNGNNNLEFIAQLPHGGEIKAKWHGDISGIKNHNLTLFIKNLALSDLAPYCYEYFTCPITKGTLSFKSQNIITNYNLKGQNKLEVYQCEVGKKNRKIKGEFSYIPLKAGLYILKDRKERINIDLPVSGQVNNPKFSYMRIAMKTLGNLLVKVALSPMTFIAKQLGIASDGLDKLEIQSRQRDFTAEQYAKLKTLADVVKQKPGLILQFTQNINYEDAVKDFALSDLKKEYYISLHPSQKGLEFIDIATLNQIDNGDKDFVAFADKLLTQKNLAVEGSIEQKAMSMFKTQAETEVIKVMEQRNQKLIEYLTKTQGVAATRLKIINTPLIQLLSCKKNQYDITMNDGEEEQQQSTTPATK